MVAVMFGVSAGLFSGCPRQPLDDRLILDNPNILTIVNKQIIVLNVHGPTTKPIRDRNQSIGMTSRK